MLAVYKDPVPKRIWIKLIATVLLLGAVGAFIAVLRGGKMAYESPRYEIVERMDGLEVREYEPYLVAETRVQGTLETAGNQGFRILAAYIFGNNQGKQRIAMTSPVSQEGAEGSKIAMTAPVTQERVGAEFVIRFMMPSELSLSTLPTPNDRRIEIREIPARRLAAIRYSGRWTKERYEVYLTKLRETLRRNGYEPVGEPLWARYNPPFMPWFLRRNEILTDFAPIPKSG
jgi:effector-binding domain-containing protein